jgi:hypothetical protein
MNSDETRDQKIAEEADAAVKDVLANLSPEEREALAASMANPVRGPRDPLAEMEAKFAAEPGYADLSYEEKKEFLKEKIRTMPKPDRKALVKAMAKRMRPRGPAPVKQPPMPKPNDPCPCGAENDDGKPIKFKKCCGSNRGDLVYFVARGEEALMNDLGQVLIFESPTHAVAGARHYGWTDGDVIPLPPARFEKFKGQIPYVHVVTKEFDVAKTEDEEKAEPPAIAITSVAQIMSDAIAKETSDEEQGSTASP